MISPDIPSPDYYGEIVENFHVYTHYFKDKEISGARPIRKTNGQLLFQSGNFGIVYAFQTNHGRRIAVKFFTRKALGLKERYKKLSQLINQRNPPFLAHTEFILDGIMDGRNQRNWFPIVKMEWISGDPLTTYLEKNYRNSNKLKRFAQKWVELIHQMRIVQLSHGDLQHGNILIRRDEFVLIDYDGIYLPGLEKNRPDESGEPNYQHPHRTVRHYGPDMDNFSALLIYISILAVASDPKIWNKYHVNRNLESLIFSHEDLVNPRAPIWKDLKHNPDNYVIQLSKKLKEWTFSSYQPTKDFLSLVGGRLTGNTLPVQPPISPPSIPPKTTKRNSLIEIDTAPICAHGHLLPLNKPCLIYCPRCAQKDIRTVLHGLKRCPHCGQNIPYKSRYCPQCGQRTGWCP